MRLDAVQYPARQRRAYGHGAIEESTHEGGQVYNEGRGNPAWGRLAVGATGAFNGADFSGADSYDEQTVTAFEAGAKEPAGRRRLRLNASLYRNRYKDLLATPGSIIVGLTVRQ